MVGKVEELLSFGGQQSNAWDDLSRISWYRSVSNFLFTFYILRNVLVSNVLDFNPPKKGRGGGNTFCYKVTVLLESIDPRS